MKKTTGFTLIELLIVVVIISVLGGIILTLINSAGIRGKVRDSQRIADLKKIQSALELYFADNRSYPLSYYVPPANANWVQLGTANDNLTRELQSDYLNVIPVDPVNNSTNSDPCLDPLEFRYNYRSDGTFYNLTAIMEVVTSNDDSPCSQLGFFCGATDTVEVCYGVQNP